MGEWEFYRISGTGPDDAPYHWSWQCRLKDGSVLGTPDTFRYFLDCVAHARLHGYSNGPLLTRRKPSYTALARAAAEPRHLAVGG